MEYASTANGENAAGGFFQHSLKNLNKVEYLDKAMSEASANSLLVLIADDHWSARILVAPAKLSTEE